VIAHNSGRSNSADPAPLNCRVLPCLHLRGFVPVLAISELREIDKLLPTRSIDAGAVLCISSVLTQAEKTDAKFQALFADGESAGASDEI